MALLLVLLAEPPLLDLLGGVVLFFLLFIVPPQLLSLVNGMGVGLGSEAPFLSLLTDLDWRSFDMLVQQIPALECISTGASVWIL